MKRRSGWAEELVWCEADQKASSPFILPITSTWTRPLLCVCVGVCVWSHISTAYFWLSGYSHLVKQTELMGRHDLITSNSQILIVNQLLRSAARQALSPHYFSASDSDISALENKNSERHWESSSQLPLFFLLCTYFPTVVRLSLRGEKWKWCNWTARPQNFKATEPFLAFQNFSYCSLVAAIFMCCLCHVA